MVVRRLDGKGSETQPVGSRSLRGYAQHLRPAGHEIPAIVHQAARLSRISLRSIRATCCAARSPFRASRGRMKALLATTPLLMVGLCIGDRALTTVSVCVTCMSPCSPRAPFRKAGLEGGVRRGARARICTPLPGGSGVPLVRHYDRSVRSSLQVGRAEAGKTPARAVSPETRFWS